MTDTGKLTPQQLQLAIDKANRFRDEMTARAKTKEQQNFYLELFAISARRIQADTDAFCDHAHAVFEEIDAFGREPQLDDDWLEEVIGQKDSFYFSTSSLVSEPLSLPRRKSRKQIALPNEDTMTQAVEQAIQTFEDVISITHTEDFNNWTQTIYQALSILEADQAQSCQVPFQTLLLATELTPVELWLGLILNHHRWNIQQQHFYGPITVSLIHLDEQESIVY